MKLDHPTIHKILEKEGYRVENMNSLQNLKVYYHGQLLRRLSPYRDFLFGDKKKPFKFDYHYSTISFFLPNDTYCRLSRTVRDGFNSSIFSNVELNGKKIIFNSNLLFRPDYIGNRVYCGGYQISVEGYQDRRCTYDLYQEPAQASILIYYADGSYEDVVIPFDDCNLENYMREFQKFIKKVCELDMFIEPPEIEYIRNCVEVITEELLLRYKANMMQVKAFLEKE